MADVRSLLRQQRAARRIEHPQAAYSDGGKLLCTACHEHIRAETLWDAHVRSPGHRLRLQQRAQEQQHPVEGEARARGPVSAAQKRKIGEDDNDDDVSPDTDGAEGDDDAGRKKRSRADNDDAIPSVVAAASGGEQQPAGRRPSGADGGVEIGGSRKPATPPLGRRASGTPVAGMEVQIPSRPATPVAVRSEAGINGGSGGGSGGGSNGAGAAPRTGLHLGRSPLIPLEAASGSGSASGPASADSSFSLSTNGPVPSKAQDSLPADSTSSLPPAGGANGAPPTAVDEDEWAAFEAEVVRGAGTARPPGARSAIAAAAALSGDAVISAPVMSAADIAAAKSQEEEQAQRHHATDREIEDEREEATRALEEEFEEMEQLEARVAKLKERREALRRQHGGAGGEESRVVVSDAPAASAQENMKGAPVGGGDDSDEDEDDGEDDDFALFRFRG